MLFHLRKEEIKRFSALAEDETQECWTATEEENVLNYFPNQD